MTQIPDYLPTSRAYFRVFMQNHFLDYTSDMKEARVGPGSGYGNFYRADEVVQHMRNIVHNLEDSFGNVSIPGKFTSPKLLVVAWRRFYDFLKKKEVELIDDVYATLKLRKQSIPEPLRIIQKVHEDVLGLLEEILSMEEVKRYLPEKENISKTKPEINFEVFDIAIITALYDTEFEALKKMPIKFRKYSVTGDASNYWTTNIGKKSILIATDDKMGLSAASSLTTKIIAKFSPQYLIMAGIAAGVKDDEKNFGDILVSRYTWNYDSGKYKFNAKSKSIVFEPNPEQLELDDSIVHLINDLKTDQNILISIKDSFKTDSENQKPKTNLKVFLGPVASGSAVLADHRKIDSIKMNNRKLIGIDMETFGVYYSAKTFSKTKYTKAISIKSISDFADQRKNDKYRNYAAYTSAMFIYYLILYKLQ